MEKIKVKFTKGCERLVIKLPGVTDPNDLVVCQNGKQVVDVLKSTFTDQPEIVEGVAKGIMDYAEYIKSFDNTSINSEIYLDGFISSIANSFDTEFLEEPESYKKSEFKFAFTRPDGNNDANENHYGPCSIIMNFQSYIYICRTPDQLIEAVNDAIHDTSEVTQLLDDFCEWLLIFKSDDMFGMVAICWHQIVITQSKY